MTVFKLFEEAELLELYWVFTEFECVKFYITC